MIFYVAAGRLMEELLSGDEFVLIDEFNADTPVSAACESRCDRKLSLPSCKTTSSMNLLANRKVPKICLHKIDITRHGGSVLKSRSIAYKSFRRKQKRNMHKSGKRPKKRKIECILQEPVTPFKFDDGFKIPQKSTMSRLNPLPNEKNTRAREVEGGKEKIILANLPTNVKKRPCPFENSCRNPIIIAKMKKSRKKHKGSDRMNSSNNTNVSPPSFHSKKVLGSPEHQSRAKEAAIMEEVPIIGDVVKKPHQSQGSGSHKLHPKKTRFEFDSMPSERNISVAPVNKKGKMKKKHKSKRHTQTKQVSIAEPSVPHASVAVKAGMKRAASPEKNALECNVLLESRDTDDKSNDVAFTKKQRAHEATNLDNASYQLNDVSVVAAGNEFGMVDHSQEQSKIHVDSQCDGNPSGEDVCLESRLGVVNKKHTLVDLPPNTCDISTPSLPASSAACFTSQNECALLEEDKVSNLSGNDGDDIKVGLKILYLYACNPYLFMDIKVLDDVDAFVSIAQKIKNVNVVAMHKYVILCVTCLTLFL